MGAQALFVMKDFIDASELRNRGESEEANKLMGGSVKSFHSIIALLQCMA